MTSKSPRTISHDFPLVFRYPHSTPSVPGGFPMLTRRRFLKSAAAASAAPLVFTRDASAVAANERLAVGFIGVGTQNRGHLGGMLGRKEVEVVAVCDVVQERLDNASRTVEKRYAD